MAQLSGLKAASKEVVVDAPLRLSEHAHHVRMDDQVIVADMRSGRYFGLDGVGARAWDLIEEGQTYAELLARLSAEYEVCRSVLEADLEQLVQQLLERRLVELGDRA